MYDSERFLTVTGHMLDGFQIIIDNQEALMPCTRRIWLWKSESSAGKTTELLPEDYELLKKAANAQKRR